MKKFAIFGGGLRNIRIINSKNPLISHFKAIWRVFLRFAYTLSIARLKRA